MYIFQMRTARLRKVAYLDEALDLLHGQRTQYPHSQGKDIKGRGSGLFSSPSLPCQRVTEPLLGSSD